MSPRYVPIVRMDLRFPRVSGDEPAPMLTPSVDAGFSPRERG